MMNNGLYGVSPYGQPQTWSMQTKKETVGEGRLSESAKSYLNGLRTAYSDYDFVVADYGDDRKALSKQSSKEFSVVLSSSDVERMSKDKKFAAEKLHGINGAVRGSIRINEQFGYERTSGKTGNVTSSPFSSVKPGSSLTPKVSDEYGYTIGDVKLSDKGKEYYKELKKKFGGSEFILVSRDMKSQVQANAASYGNSSKLTVLIDEDKIEKMATDETFRKRYEGIIAMSQGQLTKAGSALKGKESLVKNFGMSVGEDGDASFFATVKKSSKDQSARIEKQKAAKKEKAAADKKRAVKEEQKEHIEKIQDKRSEDVAPEDNEYVQIHANTMDELLERISSYLGDRSGGAILSEVERSLGQNLDFKL